MLKTQLPPCCLRFHPLSSDYVFAGTYKLDDVARVKYGSVDVLRCCGTELTLLQSIPSDSAILDLQFSPFDFSLFATGHSDGSVKLWRAEVFESVRVTQLSSFQTFEKDNLVTSIKFQDCDKENILVTSTQGETCLLKLKNGAELVKDVTFDYSHSLECWIGNFGNFNETRNCVYTGGDDFMLIANDIRTNTNIFQTNKVHGAGITSILTATPGDSRGQGSWSTNDPFKLYTGGYDDNLVVSDLRHMPNGDLLPYAPKKVDSMNLSGGVWRLVPFKEASSKLLVCCMYDGAKIVDCGDGITIDKEFRENHTSMVYGGDVSYEAEPKFGTCSFYDCVVQVWR